MMASGWPSTSARRSSSSVSSIEWRPGGGGHVHQLLDVPPRRLRLVGGHVEAAGHPGDVAHVQLLPARQVRVPVGAGRVPQVHVGVDDPRWVVGSSGLLARRCAASAPSNQSGTPGPPKVMLPLGRGWLRRPTQPGPATSSAPDSAVASGLHSRWATSSPIDRPRSSFGASTLTAKAATRSPVAPRPARASCADAWARLRPPAVVASVSVTSRTGRSARDGVVGHGPGPAGVGVDVLRRCRRARRAPAPSRSSTRSPDGAPARATTTASSGPALATAAASASAAPSKPEATPLDRDRGARHASGLEGGGDRGRHLRVGRRRRRTSAPRPAGGRRRSARRRSARTAGCSRRCSPAAPRPAPARRRRRPRARAPARPRRRCAPPRAAAVRRSPPPRTRRRRAPGRCTRRGPRPRGGRRTARAARAPASSRARARPWPTSPTRRPPLRAARPSAAVTIRVTAIGDMALTTTPGGACRPSCQVSEATARLAQP